MTFREVPPFRKAERKSEIAKNRKFHVEIVQENSQSFLFHRSFVVAMFVDFWYFFRIYIHYFCQLKKRSFKICIVTVSTLTILVCVFAESSLYSSLVQYCISCSFIANLSPCYITVLVMCTNKFPTLSARSHDSLICSDCFPLVLGFPEIPSPNFRTAAPAAGAKEKVQVLSHKCRPIHKFTNFPKLSPEKVDNHISNLYLSGHTFEFHSQGLKS